MSISYSHFAGGLLLIIGTSIGGGMLALPIATASAGFATSVVFLILCWFIMTAGALLVLEVNLRLPPGSNMVSMAKATLGLPGQILAWITYLFLFYTLLAGYISGGGDVLSGILSQFNMTISDSLASFLFTFCFALVVYGGVRSVDYVNRGLMFGKLGIYFLLLLIISPHIYPVNLQGGDANTITQSIMILITSFGFASLVPILRVYFHGNIKVLRTLILVGSLIPLICYILWNAVIMGAISAEGEQGLVSLFWSERAISGLANALSQSVNSSWITVFFNIFTSICMLTAFLGVSLGLFDFLSDGLKIQKESHQAKGTLLLTFIPPLLIVWINPGIYLQAMNYAGICCVILLLLLPIFMAWRSRNQKMELIETVNLLPGGYTSLALLTLIGFGLLTISV